MLLADYSRHFDIRARRPMFNDDTPIGKVPTEWLQKVEPKIVRKGFGGCWLSFHATTPTGYPIINVTVDGKRTKMSLAKYVMKMFYEFPDDYRVRRTCPYPQCVNPNHLYLTLNVKE